jgi:general secretion pathway protein C
VSRLGASARAASPREWALAIGGGLALAAGLVWWLRGAPPEPAPAAAPAPALPVAAPPAAPPPPPAATMPPGLILRGTLPRAGGGSAVIESADGKQRLVRVGGTVAPGVRLMAVEARRVLLAAGETQVPLGFPDALAESGPAVTMPDANRWRLALAPVRGPGGITGWRITDAGAQPLLGKAGLMAGDIVLEANGTPLISEEKIIELGAELAANGALELRYTRAGKPGIARITAPR